MAKLLLATSDAFEKWEIGGRIQMSATTEVPFSKIPNSQMFIWGPAMSWRLSRGYSLPLPICKWDSTQHTPLDPERNRVNRDLCKMEPKASVPAREVKGIAVGAGIEYTTDIGDSHDFSMCDQTTKH